MVYEARKQSMARMEHGLLKRYALSMEDKMADEAFGRALRIMGETAPLRFPDVRRFLFSCATLKPRSKMFTSKYLVTFEVHLKL